MRKINRRQITIQGCILLLTCSIAPLSASGQEAPTVTVRSIAPGAITVYWSHSGFDVSYFIIQRQNPPYSDDSVVNVGKSDNPATYLTDTYLTPNTLYKYRVCAVNPPSQQTCSDWMSARTLPSPSTSSSGSPSGGQPSQPKHQLRTPTLTATANHPIMILLHWGSGPEDLDTLGNIQLYRDGQVAFDANKYGSGGDNYEDDGLFREDAGRRVSGQRLHPNTEYTYKVCFIGYKDAEGETKCSNEVTAMGKPIPPTPLADVTISKEQGPTSSVRKAQATGKLNATVRNRTVILANWRKPDPNTDVPGQFITVEREDKSQLDKLRVGPSWVEIKRIKAKGDPTSIAADVTPDAPEPGTQRGNTYRVCAVVPALGDKGKVCSSPTVLQ